MRQSETLQMAEISTETGQYITCTVHCTCIMYNVHIPIPPPPLYMYIVQELLRKEISISLHYLSI